GRAREVYARITALPGVAAIGIDMHIGSQIEDMSPFDNAYALMAELVRELRAAGHNIRHVDVGGGLGIPYHADGDAPPLPAAYAARREAGRFAGGDVGGCLWRGDGLDL